MPEKEIVIKIKARTLERFIYLAVIAILLVLLFYNLFNNKAPGGMIINASTPTTLSSVSTTTSTLVTTTTVTTIKKLVGIIGFSIEKIYTQNLGEDTAKFERIVFTIDNQKDVVLHPKVELYIYDESTPDDVKYIKRAVWSYPRIEPGEKRTAIISDIKPSIVKDLNLTKTVELVLKDNSKKIKSIKQRVKIS